MISHGNEKIAEEAETLLNDEPPASPRKSRDVKLVIIIALAALNVVLFITGFVIGSHQDYSGVLEQKSSSQVGPYILCLIMVVN